MYNYRYALLGVVAIIGLLIFKTLVLDKVMKKFTTKLPKLAKLNFGKLGKIFDKTFRGMYIVSKETLGKIREEFAEATADMVWASESDMLVMQSTFESQILLITDSLGDLVYSIDTVAGTVKDASGDIVGDWDTATGEITLFTGGVIKIFETLGLTVQTMSGDVVTDLSDIATGMGDLSTDFGDLADDIDTFADDIEQDIEDMQTSLDLDMEDMATDWDIQWKFMQGSAVLNAGLMVAAINPVAGAILIAAGAAIIFRDDIQDAFDALNDFLREVGLISPAANKLKEDFEAANESVPPFIRNMYELRNPIEDLFTQFDELPEKIGGLLNWLDLLRGGLMELCFKHATPAAEMFMDTLEHTRNMVNQTTNDLDEMGESLRSLEGATPTIGEVGRVGEFGAGPVAGGEPREQHITITMPVTIDMTGAVISSDADIDDLTDRVGEKLGEKSRELISLL